MKIYDGLLHKGRPETEALGLSGIVIAYWGGLRQDSNHDECDFEKLSTYCQKAQDRGQMLILDIEHWEIVGAETDDEACAMMNKFLAVLDFVH